MAHGGLLVVAGVVLRFLLPTPLHVQVVHHMPRCVSACVRPNCSTPPHVVLVVRHLPPHIAVCARPKYSTSRHGARGHCVHLHGFRGCRAPSAGGARPFVVDVGVVRTSVVPLIWGKFFHCTGPLCGVNPLWLQCLYSAAHNPFSTSFGLHGTVHHRCVRDAKYLSSMCHGLKTLRLQSSGSVCLFGLGLGGGSPSVTRSGTLGQ